VLLAGIIGTPLAGCLLLAWNFAAAGRRSAAALVVLAGALLSGALILYLYGAFVTLEAWAIVSFAPVVGVFVAALLLQAAGAWGKGRPASWGAAVGCGVLGLVLQLGAGYGYDSLFRSLWPPVEFGGGEEVVYFGGATEADARRVGEVLQQEKLFDGSSGWSVQVGKSGGTYQVAFTLKWGAWDEPELVADYERLRARLAQEAFGGQPVEIHLCNELYITMKVLS
jgi:hypothetical protein